MKFESMNNGFRTRTLLATKASTHDAGFQELIQMRGTFRSDRFLKTHFRMVIRLSFCILLAPETNLYRGRRSLQIM